MGYGKAIIVIKAILDLLAAGFFAAHCRPPMAAMFFSFVLVDLTTLWVSL